MIWLNPSTDYRSALKKGMIGTDVAALQINFSGLNVDGHFGDLTEARVEQFQIDNKVSPVDGIAGQITQKKLIVKRCESAERKFNLPNGFFKSKASNETSFCVSAVTNHPSDDGIDVGGLQMSTGKTLGSQEFYQYAYNIKLTAADVGAEARHIIDNTPNPVPSKYFDDLAGGNIDKFKKQMAILHHNWPDAAEDIPRYGVIYEFDLGRDDKPADWIVEVTNGRLQTPRQWVYSYIERASVYIKW